MACVKLPHFMTLVLPSAGFLDQEKDASPVWWLENSSYPIEVSAVILIIMYWFQVAICNTLCTIFGNFRYLTRKE